MNKSRRKSAKPRWLDEVAEANYPAAESYLRLVYSPGKAAKLIARLRAAALEEFMAKDIFRASGLSLLGISNTHIVRDHGKIAAGKALSPILLVRDTANGKVVVADGYHRMCAVYSIDEDAWVPCKIV